MLTTTHYRSRAAEAAAELDARLRAIEANCAAALCGRLPPDAVLAGSEELARRVRRLLEAEG